MYDQRPVEQLPGCNIYHFSLHLPKLIKVNVSLQRGCREIHVYHSYEVLVPPWWLAPGVVHVK